MFYLHCDILWNKTFTLSAALSKGTTNLYIDCTVHSCISLWPITVKAWRHPKHWAPSGSLLQRSLILTLGPVRLY